MFCALFPKPCSVTALQSLLLDVSDKIRLEMSNLLDQPRKSYVTGSKYMIDLTRDPSLSSHHGVYIRTRWMQDSMQQKTL